MKNVSADKFPFGKYCLYNKHRECGICCMSLVAL